MSRCITEQWRVYEPSFFGTYSKKIGMWLFLLSDSLTFGALLAAYTYGRVSYGRAWRSLWPTPFHSESIRNATVMTAFLLTSSLTMVLAVRASVFGNAKVQRLWLLATMACGVGFIVLHGREWSNLIAEGLTLPFFRAPPHTHGAAEFENVTKTVPQFAATFFGLTGMHMLHVTIGVIYLGVIALRKWFIPILLALLAGGLARDAGVQPVSRRIAFAADWGDCDFGDHVAEAEALRFFRC